MRVHLPEHFDGVSDRDRSLLLERCFTRMLRRGQHALEMRSIRAVFALITRACLFTVSFVPAWGADVCSDVSWLYARSLRCFIRCETTSGRSLCSGV
jgi:hypothetical protein